MIRVGSIVSARSARTAVGRLTRRQDCNLISSLERRVVVALHNYTSSSYPAGSKREKEEEKDLPLVSVGTADPVAPVLSPDPPSVSSKQADKSNNNIIISSTNNNSSSSELIMPYFMSSLFISASAKLASKMEDMRDAEAKLVAFAHRFSTASSASNRQQQQQQQIESREMEQGELLPTVELFDTKIPRSVVPLKDGRKCRVYHSSHSCANYTTEAEARLIHEQEQQQQQAAAVENGDDSLIMHGVKVTDKSSSASSSSSSNGSPSAPLVLLHGYANGALYFYRNLLGLSKHFGTVYSLDMLGWGLSSRPPFETTDTSIETAEDFFVDSLEAWRRVHRIDKMTLAGHSMGGYLSVAYTERYPQHVHKLILLSPVGVPEQKKEDEQEESQRETKRRNMPLRYRFMLGLATTLFDRGTTPGSIIRTLPTSRGRRMIEGYVQHRLPAISCPDEQQALTNYLYTNLLLPGSGEYALNRILTPMAMAKKPTVYRIPKLNVQSVSFVYGERDWMDINGGFEVQRICDEMEAGGMKVPHVEVYGVRNAGHLLMLENWEEFNAAVVMAASAGGAGGADDPNGMGERVLPSNTSRSARLQ